jgi:hypothetical protein
MEDKIKNRIRLLFNLKSEHFMSGISTNVHLDNQGLFFKGNGINPFVNPSYQAVNPGLLQMSANPTDITGGVVLDAIYAGASRVLSETVGNLYMIGTSGYLYNQNLSAGAFPPTLLRPGSTIATPANGIEIYQSLEGLEYLYYFRTTKIGRWDFDGPSGEFIDDWATGLTNTTQHPTHFFMGNVYFGNGDAIGMIYSITGFGATVNSTVLTFPLDFRCTCIDDDGNFLVAGITKNKGSLIMRAVNKVIFWDTISARHNKEWLINDYTITAIKKFGNGHIAFGGRGMWYFDFNTKPQKILPVLGPRYGFPNAVDIVDNGIFFGGGEDSVGFYGKMIPNSSNAYFRPIFNFENDAVFIDSKSTVNTVYFATVDPALYHWNMAGSGGTTTTYPETVYIDLNDEVYLTRMDILLGEPLATGDRFTLQTQSDEDTVATDYGSFEYDIHGAVKKIRLNKEIRANQLKLLFNFQTGNVKIKSIKGYGYTKP